MFPTRRRKTAEKRLGEFLRDAVAVIADNAVVGGGGGGRFARNLCVAYSGQGHASKATRAKTRRRRLSKTVFFCVFLHGLFMRGHACARYASAGCGRLRQSRVESDRPREFVSTRGDRGKKKRDNRHSPHRVHLFVRRFKYTFSNVFNVTDSNSAIITKYDRYANSKIQSDFSGRNSRIDGRHTHSPIKGRTEMQKRQRIEA